MPDQEKHSHGNIPDEAVPTSVPRRLVRAHQWLIRLALLGVVVVIAVSLIAMPEESRIARGGAAVLFGGVLGLVVVAGFAAVGAGRYGDVPQGLRDGVRPALITAVGGLCLALAAYTAPGNGAFAAVVALAVAAAGTGIALGRARDRARPRCPQCTEGRVEEYRVKGTGEVVRACFACETTWAPDPEMAAAAPNGMPLRLYMAGRGFDPCWEGLDEIRRPA